MKATFNFYILVLLLGVSLMGCTLNNENVGEKEEDEEINQINETKETITNFTQLVGYVTKKDENKILVVSPEPEDYSANGGEREHYDAVWISTSNIAEDILVGQRIEVLFEGSVFLIYPGQGSAKDISVQSTETQKNSKISEVEAIQEAINQLETDDFKNSVIIVKSVNYDDETSSWYIDLNDDNFQIEG
ncbi:DUF3221 domain-containing protein [Peribacillus huizhouensis]|uniref:DUF3221 domain-containing protein n=1 Tax=Peribacillus huizhouensis TaxID=1501239 RepID=A0ABR6CXV2_9BACI|nr:DUF3221 domain-containing protein [Peribacillus huizhouensis]MBA9029445.1 hypothetical protein [Peribacillus huizhouensis]